MLRWPSKILLINRLPMMQLSTTKFVKVINLQFFKTLLQIYHHYAFYRFEWIF